MYKEIDMRNPIGIAGLLLFLLLLSPLIAQDGSEFPATPDDVNPDMAGVETLIDAWLASKGLDPWGRSAGAGIDLSDPPDAGSLSRSAWVWTNMEAADELHRYVWERLPRPEAPAPSGTDDGAGDPASSTHGKDDDPQEPASDESWGESADGGVWDGGSTGESQDLGSLLGDDGGVDPLPADAPSTGLPASDPPPSETTGGADEVGSTGDAAYRPGPPGGSLALSWAMNKAEGTVNSQNTIHTTADGLQWNDWCLFFVYTAWANAGRGMPAGLSGASAHESLENFRRAGNLRPIDGNIPEGCPVFWAKKDGRKWGHIAIATGKLAADGSPLIVSSNSGSARPQVMEQALTWLNRWYGAEAAGWGYVKGTP